MEIYNLVHVLPDKTEETILRSVSLEGARAHADLEQYPGYWLSWERKMLKNRKGELRVRVEYIRPSVVSTATERIGHTHWVQCLIKYGDGIVRIHFARNVFTGLDADGEIVWSADSITGLAELINKDLAYDINQLYESYLDKHYPNWWK